jgi:hypothetical protein
MGLESRGGGGGRFPFDLSPILTLNLNRQCAVKNLDSIYDEPIYSDAHSCDKIQLTYAYWLLSLF